MGRRDQALLAAALLAANLLVAALVGLGFAPLVLAAGVVLPAAVAIAARPQRGVLLLVLLVPFDGLLLIVPHPGVAEGWKEALVLVVLALTTLATAPAGGRGTREVPGWVVAVVALLVLGLLSAVVTARPQVLVGLKIGYFYLLVPLILWRCPFDRRDRDHLVSVLVGTGIVTALYGLAQQVLGHAALNQLGYEYDTALRFTGGYLRSISSFTQPFPFAFFLMLVLLVAIPHALDQPSRFRSKVIFLALPLLAGAIGVTFVRAAWTGLALGLLVLGISRYRVLLLGVPIALLCFAVLPSSLTSTALSTSSSSARLSTWGENLDAISGQPLGFGVGTGGAAVNVDGPGQLEGPTLKLPDNHYFKTLYELGVLGLWFFCLLLLAAYGAVRRVARQATGDDVPLAWGATAYVSAAAVAALTSNFFEIFPADLLFWTILGVVTLPAPGDPGVTAVSEPKAGEDLPVLVPALPR